MPKTPLVEIKEAFGSVRALLRTVRAARRDGEVTREERAEIRIGLADVLGEVADVLGDEWGGSLREVAAHLARYGRPPVEGTHDPGSLT